MNFKRAFYTSGVIITCSITIATAAFAAGPKGTWKHGYSGVGAYSNYYLPKQSHGSRVVNINNGSRDTANQIAGAYSHATVGDLWDPASFYYSDSTYAGAKWK